MIFEDLESLSREAARIVLARPRRSIVLAGGSTPRRLYEILAGHPELRDVEFFWGDERPVPPDHQESNFRLAWETFLAKIGATKVNRIEAERPDREAAARAYEGKVRRAGLDLVLLGLGPDGHTASLFPGTGALAERKRWVVPNFVPKFGHERITMTAPAINAAAEIVFLVAGADKAEALAAVLEGPREPDRVPAQFVRSATWLVDRAAAGKLKRTP